MITKRPIVVLLMPDSFNQIVSVESVNKKGKPLENPKRKIDKIRLSIKATTLFFQECINGILYPCKHLTLSNIA